LWSKLSVKAKFIIQQSDGKFAGKHGYGDKGRLVQYWARLGCWFSPYEYYGPISLGARFETSELFISLIFEIFSGSNKPRITETADTESAYTGVFPY
jgi:hypothetical protein